jgi:hypothetical protein
MTWSRDSVAASPSTEPAEGTDRRSIPRVLLSLGRLERLAALGALVCLASLPLPWYRVSFADRFRQSGFGSFGFAEAALIITLGAALVLLVEVGRGRRPPLPLHEGTLLAAAGIWAALIVGVMMLDRPRAFIGGLPAEYDFAYGIFVALGGALLLAISGMRIRRRELLRERRQLSPAEARSPTSASPPRSPR